MCSILANKRPAVKRVRGDVTACCDGIGVMQGAASIVDRRARSVGLPAPERELITSSPTPMPMRDENGPVGRGA
jgi:hypothetical protein